VYIGNPAVRRPTYTPPSQPDEHLSRLIEFIATPTDLDPLVVMGLAHYQFEAIHPFTDGNGRTGRILNILLLCQAGLLSQPVLYLSRYIVASKPDYYRHLREVTAEGAWGPWLLYLVRGVDETARRLVALVDSIQAVQSDMRESVARGTGRADATLVDVLMAQPYARIATVVERCHVTRPTASAWLKALSGAGGPLQRIQSGRQVLYLNEPLMDALRQA
jgi:Fic family protein